MPIIASFEEAEATRQQREIPGGYAWRTDILNSKDGQKNTPMAFLSESSAGRVIRTHFHDKDQFQIFVFGGGTLGKHDLTVNAVHFTRAYTAYGPLVAGEEGVGFISLYQRWDQGAHYLPESRTELQGVRERNPWQVTESPVFKRDEKVSLHKFSKIDGPDGLSAYSLAMHPHTGTEAPGQITSNGQYIVVLKGALIFSERVLGPLSVLYVEPGEFPPHLRAGPEGLDALVLSFPNGMHVN